MEIDGAIGGAEKVQVDRACAVSYFVKTVGGKMYVFQWLEVDVVIAIKGP
jgi:hypothetical protein